jgi:hypothetical protein
VTEGEWLTCGHPTPLWWFVEPKEPKRKLRLVACACCRRVWDLLLDPHSRRLVETAEAMADGLVAEEDARKLWLGAGDPGRVLGNDDFSVSLSACTLNPSVLRAVPRFASALVGKHGGDALEEMSFQAALFRDVFGNPFRPTTISDAWKTRPVLDLARQMYGSRDFSAMPILADALQDAGCEDQDVLTHCRSGGPHVRGCWVVDLILGKQ